MRRSVSKKVMVVDDDAVMTNFLKTLLELEGFAVILASRAELVLSTALAEKPDAILLDLYLADGDGMELLRQIRRCGDLRTVPVIVCSGMDVEQQSQAWGATAFLLKPYPPEQLSESLRKVLS